MNGELKNAPLPRLQDTLLDSATLARFASDLARFAQVDEVLLKGGETARASADSVPLDEALEALEQGRVRGVQVRYRYEGTCWWDTLLRTSRGIRLVRIEHRGM